MSNSIHIWHRQLIQFCRSICLTDNDFCLSLSLLPLPHTVRLSTVFSPILVPIARLRTVQMQKMAVQRLWATLHQLHQWEVAAVLQPSYVRARARGVQEGGHRLGVHWFRHGLASLYRADRKGIVIYLESRFEYIDPAPWELIDPTDDERARRRTSLSKPISGTSQESWTVDVAFRLSLTDFLCLCLSQFLWLFEDNEGAEGT